MPSPAPRDTETIDVRAQIDALIDQFPPSVLLRLWRLLITWTAPRPQRRRGRRNEVVRPAGAIGGLAAGSAG